MNCLQTTAIKALILLALALGLSACTTKTTENTHRSVKDFPNGEQLIVDRTDIHQEQIGVVSKVVYQTKDRHQYQLRFQPNDLRWENGDAEPKQLIVCPDNSAYLHFISQESNPFYANAANAETTPEVNPLKPDTEINEPEKPKVVEPYLILKNHYVRAVDKRYFFNWLGEFYWVDINKAEYASPKAGCQTYDVPNNEYYNVGVD